MPKRFGYEDIVNLSRPVSARPPMPREDRAAQFSPFAALAGHEEAIRETAQANEAMVESANKFEGDAWIANVT